MRVVHGLAISVLLAFVLATAIVLPDHLSTLVGLNNRAVYGGVGYAAVGLAALLVTLAPGRAFPLCLLAVVGVFELTHFCYMAYFGGVIDANVITHGLDELADVTEAAMAVSDQLMLAPLLVLVPYIAAGWVFFAAAAARQTVPLMSVVVIAMLAFGPYKVLGAKDPIKYFPIDVYPSISNSYLTFSLLLSRALPFGNKHRHVGEQIDFSPVAVSRIAEPVPVTVVLIMAESLASQRMSLFGFDRQTTPRLQSLTEDPHFTYAEGISAGVGTLSSFHSFWNGVRDPRDEQRFATHRTNLFRLAGRGGFHIQFYSAQGMNLLRGAGTRYIDKLVTQNIAQDEYDELHDEMLLKYARDLSLQSHNFVVFHQRSAHGPYPHNYRLRPELAIFPTEDLPYAEFQRNGYDNAVRYNDFIIHTLITIMRERVAGPLLIAVTSDHGQFLGENPAGLFGHGQLDPGNTRVPVLFYSHGLDVELETALRKLQRPTHYELIELLALAFGYELGDADAEPGVFYINGSGRFGRHGYIRIDKGPLNEDPPRFEIIPAG